MFLTVSRFQCIKECESFVDKPGHITEAGLGTLHLDNRKEMPVLLPPGAEGHLQAYGFRLLISPIPSDSFGVYEYCSRYYLDPGIADIHIFTLTSVPGISGPDVSGLFRYQHTVDRVPTYLTLSQTAPQITRDLELNSWNRYDFLLVEPPATEGWYQFELRMTMQDSSIISTVTDSIYLK
jgi:hypothetical protein